MRGKHVALPAFLLEEIIESTLAYSIRWVGAVHQYRGVRLAHADSCADLCAGCTSDNCCSNCRAYPRANCCAHGSTDCSTNTRPKPNASTDE